MNNGMSILEILVAMAIGLSILSIVIINVSQTSSISKRVTTKQQRLESIFHTVDTIKSDLTKCGMRLQEAGKQFDLSFFENTADHFTVVYGIDSEPLISDSEQGEKVILIDRNQSFKQNKRVLIYNLSRDCFEYNEIKKSDKGLLTLSDSLKNSYPKHSPIILLKQVEYKLYTKQLTLKRKVNRGYFQPLIEEVTDFYINFFPESKSVLYKIEVNRKEQIRGYIFLINLVS